MEKRHVRSSRGQAVALCAALIVVAVGWWSVSAVAAQVIARPVTDLSSLTPRQRQIFQQAINPSNGFLTKELHAEFWSPIIQKFGTPTEQDIAKLKSVFDAIAGAGLNFQRETWRSAVLSARAGKVTHTKDYFAAQRRVRELKVSGLPVATAEQAAANGDRVLLAAATKSPLRSGAKTFYITEDLAQRVIAGLDGALARVARLANPQWSDTSGVKETRYDDLGIAMLTNEPFVRKEHKLALAAGQTTQQVILTRTLSADRVILLAVSGVASSKFQANVDADLVGAAAAAFRAMGGRSTGPAAYQTFQGRHSVSENGAAVVAGKTMFASLRAIFRPKRRDLVQVLALGPDVGTTAVMREQLEVNLMLTGSSQSTAHDH